MNKVTLIGFINLTIVTCLVSSVAHARTRDLTYFRNLIQQAYESGAESVILDRGSFFFEMPENDSEYFQFELMEDFTIDATQTHFVFGSAKRAITIKNCSNLTIKGLSIDYMPLPFTQGDIIFISGSVAVVRIHKGYTGRSGQGQLKLRDKAYIIEKNSKSIKSGTYPTGQLNEVWLDDRTVVVNLTKTKNVENTKPGDRIVLFFSHHGGDAHTIYLTKSKNIAFKNVTVYSSIGRVFFEYQSFGNTLLDNVKVTYGGKLTGAVDDRLFTSVAAGVRSVGSRAGLRIRNSLFEGLGDDGLNLHGDYYLVLDVDRNQKVGVLSKREQYWAIGDTIISVNASGEKIGSAKILDVQENKPILDTNPLRRKYLLGSIFTKLPSTYVKYYDFYIEGELNAEPGFSLYNSDRVGQDFLVENTIYRNIRGRGIVVKAPNGVLSGNIVENVTQAGVLVSPERQLWMESGPTGNLDIRNNVIRRSNLQVANRHSTQAGALVVSSEGLRKAGVQSFSPSFVHSRVNIVNNLIENVPGPALVVSSTKRLNIYGNRFVDVNNVPGWKGGMEAGTDPTAAISIAHSDQIHLWDNKILKAGSNSKRLVSTYGEIGSITFSVPFSNEATDPR